MPIMKKLPGSKSLFLPVLQILKSGKSTHISEFLEPIQQYFGLSDAQMKKSRRESRKPMIYQSLAGTITHLVRAGAVERSGRACSRITNTGKRLLATNPKEVSYSTLRQFCGYDPTKPASPRRSAPIHITIPPPEVPKKTAPSVEDAVTQINNHTKELIAKEVRQASPEYLGRIVRDLLETLGYGSAPKDAEGERFVLTDPIGLNHIYVQTATRTKPDLADLQTFSAAINRGQADLGVFVSAEGFSDQAKGFAMGSPQQVVLLDAQTIAQLMVSHDVGVRIQQSYTIKDLDGTIFST